MAKIVATTYQADSGKWFVRKSTGAVVGSRLTVTGSDKIGDFEERTYSASAREEFLKERRVPDIKARREELARAREATAVAAQA